MEFRYKYVCRENEPWDSSELVKKENRQLERIGVKVSGIKCAYVKESGLPVYFINGLVVEILQKGNAQTIKILEMMGYKRYMRLLDTREGKRQYVISLHRQIPLRKWLIYQKPTGGLYAFEYLTTEEDISPYPYITADRLPVMINSYGGYSTFDEATVGKILDALKRMGKTYCTVWLSRKVNVHYPERTCFPVTRTSSYMAGSHRRAIHTCVITRSIWMLQR